MLIVTTDNVAGREIVETLGVVEGNTVQSKNMFKDMSQGFKNMVGGELRSYTKMMGEAREISKRRMAEQANELGADAIVGFRYTSASVTQGAAEMVAYGTAVKLK